MVHLQSVKMCSPKCTKMLSMHLRMQMRLKMSTILINRNSWWYCREGQTSCHSPIGIKKVKLFLARFKETLTLILWKHSPRLQYSIMIAKKQGWGLKNIHNMKILLKKCWLFTKQVWRKSKKSTNAILKSKLFLDHWKITPRKMNHPHLLNRLNI